MLGVIEIFALIVAVIAIIKILFIIVKPKSWMNLVKPFYSVPMLTSIVALLLSAVVLYYLVQSGITIVQIFAVMLFVALIACVSVSVYFKEVIGVGEKILKEKKFIRKAWLSIIIWLILSIWVFWAVLA